MEERIKADHSRLTSNTVSADLLRDREVLCRGYEGGTTHRKVGLSLALLMSFPRWEACGPCIWDAAYTSKTALAVLPAVANAIRGLVG